VIWDSQSDDKALGGGEVNCCPLPQRLEQQFGSLGAKAGTMAPTTRASGVIQICGNEAGRGKQFLRKIQEMVRTLRRYGSFTLFLTPRNCVRRAKGLLVTHIQESCPVTSRNRFEFRLSACLDPANHVFRTVLVTR